MEEKKISDFFKGDTPLEQEFEIAKKQHILRTCYKAKELDLIKEAESTLNIPTFLLKDQIKREAVEQVLNIIEDKGDEGILNYYEEAWEKVSTMSR